MAVQLVRATCEQLQMLVVVSGYAVAVQGRAGSAVGSRPGTVCLALVAIMTKRYLNSSSAANAKCQQAGSSSDGLEGRTGCSFGGVISVFASRINSIQWLAVCSSTSGSIWFEQPYFVLNSWPTEEMR